MTARRASLMNASQDPISGLGVAEAKDRQMTIRWNKFAPTTAAAAAGGDSKSSAPPPSVAVQYILQMNGQSVYTGYNNTTTIQNLNPDTHYSFRVTLSVPGVMSLPLVFSTTGPKARAASLAEREAELRRSVRARRQERLNQLKSSSGAGAGAAGSSSVCIKCLESIEDWFKRGHSKPFVCDGLTCIAGPKVLVMNAVWVLSCNECQGQFACWIEDTSFMPKYNWYRLTAPFTPPPAPAAPVAAAAANANASDTKTPAPATTTTTEKVDSTAAAAQAAATAMAAAGSSINSEVIPFRMTDIPNKLTLDQWVTSIGIADIQSGVEISAAGAGNSETIPSSLAAVLNSDPTVAHSIHVASHGSGSSGSSGGFGGGGSSSGGVAAGGLLHHSSHHHHHPINPAASSTTPVLVVAAGAAAAVNATHNNTTHPLLLLDERRKKTAAAGHCLVCVDAIELFYSSGQTCPASITNGLTRVEGPATFVLGGTWKMECQNSGCRARWQCWIEDTDSIPRYHWTRYPPLVVLFPTTASSNGGASGAAAAPVTTDRKTDEKTSVGGSGSGSLPGALSSASSGGGGGGGGGAASPRLTAAVTYSDWVKKIGLEPKFGVNTKEAEHRAALRASRIKQMTPATACLSCIEAIEDWYRAGHSSPAQMSSAEFVPISGPPVSAGAQLNGVWVMRCQVSSCSAEWQCQYKDSDFLPKFYWSRKVEPVGTGATGSGGDAAAAPAAAVLVSFDEWLKRLNIDKLQ